MTDEVERHGGISGKPLSTNIIRLMDLTPPEKITEAIRKQAFGQEIFWEYCLGTMQVVVPDPTTGLPRQMDQPCLNITMGMKGRLLGQVNYVWFTAAIDPNPEDRIIDKAIQIGLADLYEQRDAQRGQSPN